MFELGPLVRPVVGERDSTMALVRPPVRADKVELEQVEHPGHQFVGRVVQGRMGVGNELVDGGVDVFGPVSSALGLLEPPQFGFGRSALGADLVECPAESVWVEVAGLGELADDGSFLGLESPQVGLGGSDC